jgi:nucleotide-binding universal stress UspA family protein
MTRKPIVVGVDDSREAARAASLAWRLAAAAGAPFTLVHVVREEWVGLIASQLPALEDAVALVLREVRARIAVALRRRLPAEAVARLHVVVGRPEAVLADLGAGAQFVVVGGKTHGALSRGLGGSTAHNLIRRLNVPVLIVTTDRWPLRRVLAAVDLSFAARPTLRVAQRLARLSGGRVRALHVVEPIRPARVAASVDRPAFERDAERGFARQMRAFPEVAARDRVVRYGAAAESIAAEGARWRADLVVVGSHGKGWVDRMLVGSVTERLLALRAASVLIVPVRPRHPPRRQRVMLSSATVL